jgi:hypothetical protein
MATKFLLAKLNQGWNAMGLGRDSVTPLIFTSRTSI